MQFESCNVDPRIGNTLTSPEFTLQSDEQLAFTMMSHPSGDNSGSTVHVYRTEAAKHPAVLLGTYSLPTPAVNANASTPFDFTNGTNGTAGTNESYVTETNTEMDRRQEITHSVCLPAGTYQLVFIAKEESATQSQVSLNDVVLTGIPCTYNRSLGKERLIYFTTPPSAVTVVFSGPNRAIDPLCESVSLYLSDVFYSLCSFCFLIMCSLYSPCICIRSILMCAFDTLIKGYLPTYLLTYLLNTYVGPPYCQVEMCAGRIAW